MINKYRRDGMDYLAVKNVKVERNLDLHRLAYMNRDQILNQIADDLRDFAVPQPDDSTKVANLKQLFATVINATEQLHR